MIGCSLVINVTVENVFFKIKYFEIDEMGTDYCVFRNWGAGFSKS